MLQRPHWSYSSISQYLTCPLRYYFQRILGIPQTTISCSLVLGSSVHAALAAYHRSIQQNLPPSITELHQVFSETWNDRKNQGRMQCKDGENPQDAFDQGIALVELYLQEPPPQNIFSIEKEILSPVHNSRGEYLETPLLAIADLITAENETLRVREFKTAARAYSEMEAESSLQPTCYINAVQEAFNLPATVEYTVLIKTKTPKVQRLAAKRTEADLGRLGDIIETIEKAVQANIFYPVETPLHCSTCSFRKPCREWGRNNYQPERVPLQTIGPGEV